MLVCTFLCTFEGVLICSRQNSFTTTEINGNSDESCFDLWYPSASDLQSNGFSNDEYYFFHFQAYTYVSPVVYGAWDGVSYHVLLAVCSQLITTHFTHKDNIDGCPCVNNTVKRSVQFWTPVAHSVG